MVVADPRASAINARRRSRSSWSSFLHEKPPSMRSFLGTAGFSHRPVGPVHWATGREFIHTTLTVTGRFSFRGRLVFFLTP
jgi:hypothetical protein